MPWPVRHQSQQEGTPAAAGVPARWSTKFVLLFGGLVAICMAVVAASARSSQPEQRAGDAPASFVTSGAKSGTPAEQRIAAAREAVDLHPKRVDGWNDLALALARRARETSDPKFYQEAWAATERALAVEPNHLEARKLQVWILLGQHEFPRAVEAAEQINKEMPDDVLVYGFLVDGYTELGRYAEAEKAAQWMLDMRPGNVPGLTRAAHLRELFGDHEGAVELMDTAYRRTADAEVEDRAWILTQIAHLSLLTCRTEAAERLLNEALTLVPRLSLRAGADGRGARAAGPLCRRGDAARAACRGGAASGESLRARRRARARRPRTRGEGRVDNVRSRGARRDAEAGTTPTSS